MDEIESLGATTFREQRRAFGIRPKDRRHHIYIIGKTGTGKSTLLKNMVIQDLRYNHGVALIDPHGDLVEDLLNFIPKNRTNEVVYFNPADKENPVGINILEAKGEDEKQLVASSLISVFRHLWKDFWGPRLEHILYNCVLALMDTPGNTLLGVYRMLVDDEFRKIIVGNIKDPVVKM
ncbi:MAG: type IV secretion system DNA-binding domain-containing protein, partial [bacterium]